MSRLGQVLLRSLLMRNLFKSYRLFTMKSVLLIHMLPHTLNRCMMHDAYRLFTMKSVLLIHMLPHTLNRCMMHDAHTSSYEQSAIAAARKAGGNNYTTSGMPNTETRSSGTFLKKVITIEYLSFFFVHYLNIWDSFCRRWRFRKKLWLWWLAN